jgi:hypothetical protein
MRIVQHTSEYLVIDDFLATPSFHAVVRALQYLDYRPMHQDRWIKAYGASTGVTLRSDLVARGGRTATPEGSSMIASFVEAILAIGGEAREALPFDVGDPRLTLSGRAILMGRGAGLSWHRDGAQLSGAYTYYAHPRWNSSWGGELMILDREVGGSATDAGAAGTPPDAEHLRDFGPDLGLDDGPEAARREVGIGTFISAKANRLVVLNGTREHQVNPVTDAAGDQLRTTITGFALREPAAS